MIEEKIILVGTLEKIFRTFPDGTLVGSFLQTNTNERIKIIGQIINVRVHQTLHIKGLWDHHPKYGLQFKVSEFKTEEPITREGIVKYLASGEFAGIGIKTSERIYEMFGDKTFDIIDKDPEKLLNVKNFNRKQLTSVQKVRKNQQEERSVITYLRGKFISKGDTNRIYDHFGMNSIPFLKSNPYRMTEVKGIRFLKADEYSRNFPGFDENSPERAMHAIKEIFEQHEKDGHTYFQKIGLLKKTETDLHINKDVLEKALNRLMKEERKESLKLDNVKVDDEDRIVRSKTNEEEKRIALNIKSLLLSKAFITFEEEGELIETIEKKIGLKLDKVQSEAIDAVLNNKVLIITGGPGTGKTTLIKFILGIMRRKNPSVSLAAPTGRAAKRLTETTGIEAQTIHRLLEYGYVRKDDQLDEKMEDNESNRAGGFVFQRNRHSPLESEILIIDESSMIDTLLMDRLLEAILPSSRLVLVGDVDQLPSVGPGMVLKDLINSNIVPVIRLEHIFRQSENSLISMNAHAVLLGKFPYVPEQSRGERGFYYIRESNEAEIIKKITEMVKKNIPDEFGFDPFQEIQVLTPMHRGQTGSINLNKSLQAILNPDEIGFVHRENLFKTGDRVMQQHNDYKKNIFNGDMGIISECDPINKEIVVRFDQNVIHYSKNDLDQLVLAYAITVHKSQGSEYPALVLPLTTNHYMMLQRNLLYTAMTRGKQLVVLIGMEKAIWLALNNKKAKTRYTLLGHHLRDEQL